VCGYWRKRRLSSSRLANSIGVFYNLTRPAFTALPIALLIVGELGSLLSPLLSVLNGLWFFSRLVRDLVLNFILGGGVIPAYIATFLAALSGCNVNTYADSQDSDKCNFGKDYSNPIVNGRASAKTVANLSVFSAVLSLLVSLAVSYLLFMVVLLGHFLSFTYSYKPRLKSKAPLDITWNTLGLASLPFVAGHIVYQEVFEGAARSSLIISLIYSIFLPLTNFSYFLIYFSVKNWFPFRLFLSVNFFGAAFYTVTATLDYEADKAAGLKTLSVALGKRTCLLVGLLLSILGVFTAFDIILADVNVMMGVAFFLASFIWAIINPARNRMWVALKILMFMFALCCFNEFLVRFVFTVT